MQKIKIVVLLVLIIFANSCKEKPRINKVVFTNGKSLNFFFLMNLNGERGEHIGTFDINFNGDNYNTQRDISFLDVKSVIFQCTKIYKDRENICCDLTGEIVTKNGYKTSWNYFKVKSICVQIIDELTGRAVFQDIPFIKDDKLNIKEILWELK
jgi:hypothetical protein